MPIKKKKQQLISLDQLFHQIFKGELQDCGKRFQKNEKEQFSAQSIKSTILPWYQNTTKIPQEDKTTYQYPLRLQMPNFQSKYESTEFSNTLKGL